MGCGVGVVVVFFCFVFFLGGERSLEIFQTVPFCFQKNPSTCVNVLFVPWPIV